MTLTSDPVRSRTRGGLALSVLAALSVLLLALVALGWGPLLDFDRWAAEGLHGPAVDEPDVTHANRILTDWVWDPWTMRLLTVALVGWLLWRRERLLAGVIAGGTMAGVIVQQGMKAAVGRDRPRWPDPVDSAHYAAYPSGHAMSAVVTLGLVVWLLRRYGASGGWQVAAWVVAAVSVAGVGFTRVWLGVHWPSDVVGGWLMGAAVVLGSAAFYERVRSGS
ncbi:phosphatase PAP2 family protein [Streptomyces sp. A7024]|uniref:Phosphatase PAP2 family protein n=1 Tax=Streptomyces coryli TaxID=1128680 RepID=A0A6G4TWW2_9ACTN|nr:phosphatase PAP2 family protein [Streptomyces coryli]NGN64465.1 phosphatase PAP2 family protein [Streptomyces coryli]